ncbi:hypothetical protein ACKWRH_21590 [Bradyrhizobium sp. Pa8]|uniref:hypothetical protein n=1 Tax=Bradyrhizobium sp. Pa8 TaxID=3386552 RepID=UPI00403F365B
MSIKGRSSGTPAPLLKNASAAPFVYFDNAPLYGVAGMGIEVELTAASIVPRSDGAVMREAVCVAHLRCSPQTALSLIDSLQKAVKMYSEQMAELAAQASEHVEASEPATDHAAGPPRPSSPPVRRSMVA